MKTKYILHFVKCKMYFVACQLFFTFFLLFLFQKIRLFFRCYAMLYQIPRGYKVKIAIFPPFFIKLPIFSCSGLLTRSLVQRFKSSGSFSHLANAFSQIRLQKYPIQGWVNTMCYTKLHETNIQKHDHFFKQLCIVPIKALEILLTTLISAFPCLSR